MDNGENGDNGIAWLVWFKSLYWKFISKVFSTIKHDTINHRLSRCSTKTDQLDEHEDSNGFYGQCPSQTESKCLTEEQGITSEEYEIRNTVRKLFKELI